jgi:hypothetical protein
MSSVAAAPVNLPLRLGEPDQFAEVRAFFQRAGFDDGTLSRALRVSDMSELGRVNWPEAQLEALPAALRWSIEVFIRGLLVDQGDSQRICGAKTFAAFQTLGLLRPAKKNPAMLVSPVWVYPADGFVVASDRRDDPDGENFQPATDVVFPAIYGGTLRFLQLLPDACTGEALDLCGGSGIGALHFSRSARAAATADVTERSAFFAGFNGRLNGIAIESFCGDLYQPVAGRLFDVISAHPPFVPATGQNMVYRDGGDAGEEITRRVVAGLPAHLRHGGTGVILCVACDTKERTFEQRAKQWLGDAADEFDIVFGMEKILSVEEVVESMRKRSGCLGGEETRQLFARLRSYGTRQFVYGALFLRRCARGHAPEPFRIQLAPDGKAADFERLLAWREHCRKPEFATWLARSKPRLAPGLELTVRHLVQNGTLAPSSLIFSIESGFRAALRPDGWVVPLIARLEGVRSVEEVFESARSSDELPEGFPLDALLDLVRTMIEAGYLQVEFPR